MPKAFDRIFVVMLENMHYNAVIANAYFKRLAGRGALLSNYFGLYHPSQPNYIAAVGGLAFGVVDDKLHDIALNEENVVDLLERAGVTWKAYMEDLPADKTVLSEGKYFRKHNPFVSFTNIRENPARLARIVDATELAADVAADALPQYGWYTPNIENDGHSVPPTFEPTNPVGNVDFAAQWLERFLEPLLATPEFADGTLVVVTFDESIPHWDNHVYTVLLGAGVTPGTVARDRFDHYSLLRTVEDNFDLGTLGRNDANATPFAFLWGAEPEGFDWSAHAQAPESPGTEPAGRPDELLVASQWVFRPARAVAAAAAAAAVRPERPAPTYMILRTSETDEYDKPLLAAEVATAGVARFAHAGDTFAGTARKAAKLSVSNAPVEEFDDVLALVESLPAEAEMVHHVPPISTGAGSGRVAEEERNVRVRAFLYAASREDDNDFHLILGRAPDLGATFMTMEISGLPPSTSPFFATLRDARAAYTTFFGDNLPGASYDFYDPPIPVEISGSLFFDMSHGGGGSRPGPARLRPHMPVVWEVHPVSGIVFEP
jgi:hypothetical protein